MDSSQTQWLDDAPSLKKGEAFDDGASSKATFSDIYSIWIINDPLCRIAETLHEANGQFPALALTNSLYRPEDGLRANTIRNGYLNF